MPGGGLGTGSSRAQQGGRTARLNPRHSWPEATLEGGLRSSCPHACIFRHSLLPRPAPGPLLPRCQSPSTCLESGWGVGTAGGPEPGSVGAASALQVDDRARLAGGGGLQGGGGLGVCAQGSAGALCLQSLAFRGPGVGWGQWVRVLAPSGFPLPTVTLGEPEASLPPVPTCKMGLRVKYSSGGHGSRRANVIDALRTGGRW